VLEEVDEAVAEEAEVVEEATGAEADIVDAEEVETDVDNHTAANEVVVEIDANGDVVDDSEDADDADED
jgi:hypothetical protein